VKVGKHTLAKAVVAFLSCDLIQFGCREFLQNRPTTSAQTFRNARLHLFGSLS
jgi:hypothetical protein